MIGWLRQRVGIRKAANSSSHKYQCHNQERKSMRTRSHLRKTRARRSMSKRSRRIHLDSKPSQNPLTASHACFLSLKRHGHD